MTWAAIAGLAAALAAALAGWWRAARKSRSLGDAAVELAEENVERVEAESQEAIAAADAAAQEGVDHAVADHDLAAHLRRLNGR